MGLATQIEGATKDDILTLSEYLISQYDIQPKNAGDDDAVPVDAANVSKAIAGWAYMQTHAANQGE